MTWACIPGISPVTAHASPFDMALMGVCAIHGKILGSWHTAGTAKVSDPWLSPSLARQGRRG